MKSIAFVQKCFRKYYSTDFCMQKDFQRIDRREFGFASFEGWMFRHRMFQNGEQLASFMSESVPRDVYFSCAYYEDPEAEMERKGWIGADLVFDIDADHIQTACDKTHDEWTCSTCGFAGKGVTPEECPVCRGAGFVVSTWPCEVCLDSAKVETVKLVDALTHDFGFSESEVSVFFSGHRGYHIHVANEAVETLDALARKEIVDYLLGLGLDTSFHGLDNRNLKVAKPYEGLTLDDVGWRRHIALAVQSFLSTADEQTLVNVGIGRKEVRIILQDKNMFLKHWLEKKAMGTMKGVGPATWTKIIERCVQLQSIGIDTVVTTDVHRLIRLQDTLHSKTGFKKAELRVSTIDSFDPFDSAVAFEEGNRTVLVSSAPEFRLGGRKFGPYKNEKVELPTAAAVLLACRDRGEVVA